MGDARVAAVSGGEYTEKQAKSYVKAKEVDMRTRVELYSTLQFIGRDSLRGASVIDVACGSGWLTRHLRDAGVANVKGTDISAEMIEMARMEEDKYQGDLARIEYEVEDIRNEHAGTFEEENFDVVTSNWLLVNATSRRDLRKMCQGLASKAKSGGKLVTLLIHPDLFYQPDNHQLNETIKPYGFTFDLPPQENGHVPDGAAVAIQCYTPQGEFAVEIENYHYSKQTYVEELERAGFESIEFKDKMLLSPEMDDADDWKDFFSVPLLLAIVARKK